MSCSLLTVLAPTAPDEGLQVPGGGDGGRGDEAGQLRVHVGGAAVQAVGASLH